MEGLRDYLQLGRFDWRKGGLAAAGGALVVGGVHLHKTQPDSIIGSVLFVVGWAVVAYSAMGSLQPLEPKTIVAGMSAAAVVVGALMSRRALDKGLDAPMWAQGLFLAGWAGMALAIAMCSGMGFGLDMTRVLLALGAVAIVLAGVMTKRMAEKAGKSDMLGVALFILGWVAVAGVIAYRC